MFLKSKTLISFLASLMFTLSASISFAARVNNLEAGRYDLVKGDKELCSNFSVTDEELDGKTLSLGSLYQYNLNNSNLQVESDIDAKCEFRETNKVTDAKDANSTTLMRLNEEYCSGKQRSRTLSVAILKGSEVQINHFINGAPGYSCSFKKQ